MAKSRTVAFRISNEQYAIGSQKASERGYRSIHNLARASLITSIDQAQCHSDLMLQQQEKLLHQTQIVQDGIVRILTCVDPDDALIQEFLTRLQK